MNEAIVRFEKMVRDYPQNEMARFSLGKALYDDGQYTRALEHLGAALDRRPDWMVVQILIGKSQLALGNRTAARISFERARDLAIEQNHEGPLEEMQQALADLKE